MKATHLPALGPDQVFTAIDLPDPKPGPGEVLITAKAASVNVVDTKIRTDRLELAPDAPIILGCDVAGVVSAVGEGVSAFKIGDAVYGCVGGVKNSSGTYAEQVIADAQLLAHKPANLSFAEAAALPLVAITAWEALVDRAQVQPGDRVLVHGGAGGVGHIGVQLAKALGATVHTTISGPKKAELARKLGADRTIDYRTHPVETYVAEATDGAGYDVVFDTIGGDNIAPSLQAVGVNGRVATIVSLGTAVDLTALHLKNARLDVIFMLIPLLTGKGRAAHGEILRRISALVDTGAIQPLLDEKRFTLDEVEAAHAHLQSGSAIGKIVLEIS